jgi:PAS domain-containing protein
MCSWSAPLAPKHADVDGLDPVGDEHEALLDFLYLCPHGFVEFAADGTVRMINPACARILAPILQAGSGLDNLLDVLMPFVPDLRLQLSTSAGERGLLLDGVRIHVGAPLRPRPRRDGEATNPFVLALTVLRLSADRYMGVVADVSVQVAQERRLRESEAWFAAMVEGAEGYAFFDLNAGGCVANWNVSAERLFGFGGDEALGRRADGFLAASASTAAGRAACLGATQWMAPCRGLDAAQHGWAILGHVGGVGHACCGGWSRGCTRAGGLSGRRARYDGAARSGRGIAASALPGPPYRGVEPPPILRTRCGCMRYGFAHGAATVGGDGRRRPVQGDQ